MKYLKSKVASSKWSKAYTRLLDSCVTIDYETLTPYEKEKARGSNMTCMACGMAEDNNLEALHLFGNTGSETCFTCVDDLAEDIQTYVTNYNAVLSCRTRGEIIPQDKGVVLVGETCLRRSTVYHMISNFVVEFVYGILLDNRERRTSSDSLLEITDDDVTVFEDALCRLKELATYETDVVSRNVVPHDRNYWGCVKRIRGTAISTANLVDRSKDLMRQHEYVVHVDDEYDRDEDCEDDENGEEEEEDEEVNTVRLASNRGKRRIDGDDDTATAGIMPTTKRTESVYNSLVQAKDYLVERGEHKHAVAVLEAMLVLSKK
jgi:hypothetical protein